MLIKLIACTHDSATASRGASPYIAPHGIDEVRSGEGKIAKNFGSIRCHVHQRGCGPRRKNANSPRNRASRNAIAGAMESDVLPTRGSRCLEMIFGY